MKNIAILFGGYSSEYEVSLESAYSVIKNIDKSKYHPVLIWVSKDGDWFKYDGDVEKIPKNEFAKEDLTQITFSLNLNDKKLLLLKDGKYEELKIDAAFPVVHGKHGEDGTLQGLLELIDIKNIGCNTLAASLCMDKYRSRKLVEIAGVKVPKALGYENIVDKVKLMETLNKEVKELTFPIFVKPQRAGSSYGISKVEKFEDLEKAIDLALEHDYNIIIEEEIKGFEVGAAVYGIEDLIVGEIDEIELDHGFFDYFEKYNLVTSKIHVPARISKEKSQELKETAKKIYKALGCSFFSRVDMFLTPDQEIYFNEVNTIPGFTSHSRYPSMLKEIGMSFGDVVNGLIEMALNDERATRR